MKTAKKFEVSTSYNFAVLANWSFATVSALNRIVAGVSALTSSLLGSSGGFPPLGDANVT